MISAYPHIAFVLALFVGAALGFIASGVLRRAREADDEDEPMTDYHPPVRTQVWGGGATDGERQS